MYVHEIELEYVVKVCAAFTSSSSDPDDFTSELDALVRQESGIGDVNAVSVELSEIEVIRTASLQVVDYLEADERRSA